MTYIANKALTDNSANLSEEKMLSDVIDRLIENLLDSDDELTEDHLKEIFINRIKTVKAKNNNKKRVILKVYRDRMDKDRKKIEAAFDLLREGVL